MTNLKKKRDISKKTRNNQNIELTNFANTELLEMLLAENVRFKNNWTNL